MSGSQSLGSPLLQWIARQSLGLPPPGTYAQQAKELHQGTQELSQGVTDLNASLAQSGNRMTQLDQRLNTMEQSPGAPQLPDLGPMQGKLYAQPQYNNLGQIRPFGPGEYLDRGQGKWSSEETYTTPYGGTGQWGVLPGLWLVNGVPTFVSEDQASEYAKQSGLNWPTFKSQKEAEDFANQREQAWQKVPFGGSHMQPPLWSRQFPPQQ